MSIPLLPLAYPAPLGASQNFLLPLNGLRCTLVVVYRDEKPMRAMDVPDFVTMRENSR